MHVIQYQKNEKSGPNAGGTEYLFDVTLKDADGSPINLYNCNGCGTTARFVGPNGAPQKIESDLPFDVVLTAGAVDGDAVLFNYDDQSWGSNDQQHHSNFGSYDSGKREGDTGFTC